jgi:signal transduction histidine kinase
MPETILIVDDTPANLSVLVDCLSQAGYSLMVAEDGEDALAQTARTLPDLVLLDVMMPGLDGFETCRRLKAAERTRGIPVIFMTALTDIAEKVRGFEAGAVDYVTKPIQHEEALARIATHLTIRRLSHELQQQLALKDKFMRIAGHDLRNPLSLILMSSELAQRKNVPPELADYLKSIHSSARQMRGIIDTFLAIQKPGSPLGRVDLNAIARAAVAQHGPAAERKSITVTLELADPLPPARADGGHAYQALVNFLSNALKFLPPGGAATVRTCAGEDTVRIEVQDNGPGVPPAERPALFTEYARLSNLPTAGEESTGLGLAIVKHLVESQGGRVGASFPPEGGSLFWFELPMVGGT